jgi:hypothetical protein
MQHPRDSSLEPFVRVRDHQLDAAQAAPGESTQKIDPEDLGLRGADCQAQDLAPAVVVHGNRDNYRNRYDAPILAHLQVSCVEPQIGPVAFQRAVKKRRDLLVDLGAQWADLAFGDAGHAHRLHQIVDRTGRDAVHVRLLHDRGQSLLGQATWFEKRREIAAAAGIETKLAFGRPGSPGISRAAAHSRRPRLWRTMRRQMACFIGDPTYADAILDRLVQNAHRIDSSICAARSETL